MTIREPAQYALPKGTTAAKHFMESYRHLNASIDKESFATTALYAEECYQVNRILEIRVHLMMVDRCRR